MAQLKQKTKRKSGNGTKKKRKNRLRKIIRIGILILLIVLIVSIVKWIWGLFDKKADRISLVIGADKIELKQEIIIDEEKNIYLSKDDIAFLYDENIYYNPTDKTLITTYNKHIAVLTMNKTTMTVNDTVISMRGSLKQENGTIYLPFSDMINVYDFEYNYDEKNKILIVDSTNEEKQESIILKNTKLKEKTSLFSKNLEKLEKSTKVVVIGTQGKYTKIRTNLGNIGYVKTKKISQPEKVRDDLENEKLTNIDVLNDYNEVSLEYEAQVTNDAKTFIVIPNLFNINNKFELKQIITLDSNKFNEYKTWASNNSISVCATINFDGSMNELCSSYNTRTLLINNIYTDLIKNQITMINIDFDNIDDMEGFYRFIIEMTPRFKESGIKVLVTYKDGMNRERLNNIVDYVL